MDIDYRIQRDDRADLTGPRAVLTRKFLIWVFVALAIGFSIAPIRNHLRSGSTKDYPIWYETGSTVLAGHTPYYKTVHKEFAFMYPPGASAILAMICPVGKLGMIITLVLANTLGWFVCIVGPIYLVSGAIKGQHPFLYWVPSLVSIFFVWDTYLEGQVAMFLSACLIGMFILLQKKKWWGSTGAGALLALAAGVKGFPIFAIVYLIYRRYWKATASAVICLILLILFLPMVFRGPSGAIADLKMWSTGMGATYTPEVIAQRKDRSYTWQNGSLISVTNRLLRPVVADHDDGKQPLYVNVASLTFTQVNIVIVIEGLLLCLIYVGLMPKSSERNPWSNALEMGMLLILIVLFAPLSFTYNQTWLMLPIVSILYYILMLAPTRGLRVVAGVWLAAGIIMLVLGLPIDALRVIRAAGNTFWADIIIFAELGWLLARHSSVAVTSMPPQIQPPSLQTSQPH